MSVVRKTAILAAVSALCVARPARAWSPAVNYALNCQGCHLADGSATPDLVPPLQGSVGRLVHVPEGRAYLVRLPNVASTTLSDAETAELLNWVVERFGAGERPREFAPFTAAEVALRAFRRVSLAPGARETVALEVPIAELAFYDEAASAWRVDELAYTVHVGTSSRDLPLSATLEVRARQ